MSPIQQEIQWLLDEKYGGKRTSEAEKDIVRLEKGEHVDYVIGWVDFLGCRIDLRFKPLIPRPETEYWTEKVIAELRRQGSRNQAPYSSLRSSPRPNPMISRPLPPPLRILDIFAGSGCVGVAVLKHLPFVQVDFAEKDEKLLKQIQLNADLNAIDPAMYSIIESNIFSRISGAYDCILANPPYIAEAKKNDTQESVLKNDPYSALFGGEDGLLYVTKFLEQAKYYVKPGGVLYMEFDSHQKSKIAELIRKFRYGKSEFYRDQYGNWRYVVVSL